MQLGCCLGALGGLGEREQAGFGRCADLRQVSALLSAAVKWVAAKSAQVSRRAISSGDKDSGMNGSYRLGAMVSTTMASMANTIKAMA